MQLLALLDYAHHPGVAGQALNGVDSGRAKEEAAELLACRLTNCRITRDH